MRVQSFERTLRVLRMRTGVAAAVIRSHRSVFKALGSTATLNTRTHTVQIRVGGAGGAGSAGGPVPATSVCKVAAEPMGNKGGFLPPEPMGFGSTGHAQAKARR